MGPKANLEILLPLLGGSNSVRTVQPATSLYRLSQLGSLQLANVLGADAVWTGRNADGSKAYADTIFKGH